VRLTAALCDRGVGVAASSMNRERDLPRRQVLPREYIFAVIASAGRGPIYKGGPRRCRWVSENYTRAPRSSGGLVPSQNARQLRRTHLRRRSAEGHRGMGCATSPVSSAVERPLGLGNSAAIATSFSSFSDDGFRWRNALPTLRHHPTPGQSPRFESFAACAQGFSAAARARELYTHRTQRRPRRCRQRDS